MVERAHPKPAFPVERAVDDQLLERLAVARLADHLVFAALEVTPPSGFQLTRRGRDGAAGAPVDAASPLEAAEKRSHSSCGTRMREP